MRISLKNISLIVICIIFTMSFIQCNSSNNRYENIVVENELCSYSLEYPSRYGKEYSDDLEFDVPYTNLLLLGPVGIEEAEVFDPHIGEIQTASGKRVTSSIRIYVANAKIYFGESYSAKVKMEDVLASAARWANYQLLEHSSLTVSGVKGELVEYLVDRLMPIPREDGENLDYHCAVYFDYNDLLWVIEAKCIQEMREQVKADFDYIVNSFKIIR